MKKTDKITILFGYKHHNKQKKTFENTNLFCEYQSGGLFGSPIVFRARETDIQFWSPLRTTAEAKHNCSLTFQVSNGTLFSCKRSCIELIWVLFYTYTTNKTLTYS